MYVPEHFSETRIEVLHELIRAHSFGALVTATGAGIEANHIPFVLAREPSPFGTLRGHIARANPLWREFTPQNEALVLFQGPHSYISPSWYASKKETGKVVPTWNYVVVHARGPLRIMEDRTWLRRHLEELTDQHEAEREDSWQVADAPEDFTEKLMGAIIGIEVQIGRLTGKWKVSQNRSVTDREGVASRLLQEGNPDSSALAQLVREHGKMR